MELLDLRRMNSLDFSKQEFTIAKTIGRIPGDEFPPTAVAERLNQLFPHGGSPEDIGSFLWSLWGVFILTAQCLHPFEYYGSGSSKSKTFYLVELVLELQKKQEGDIVVWGVSTRFQKQSEKV